MTPIEELVLDGSTLRFRDLAVERGYAPEPLRVYRFWVEGGKVTTGFRGRSFELGLLPVSNDAAPDRYGRTPLARLWIQSNRRGGGWALPVEVTVGRNSGGANLEVLGWHHAAR